MPGLAVIVAGALFTGIVPGTTSNDSTQAVTETTLPPPPPVVQFVEQPVVLPDDGLTRVIVRPLADALEPAITNATVVDEPSPTVDASVPEDDPGGEQPVDDFEALAQAPLGSTVVLTPTGIALRTPDGAIMPFDDLAGGPSDSATTPAPDGDPDPVAAPATTLERLGALPGVTAAMSLGDGTYALTLDDPDALDGLPLEIAADRFFTTTADRYEAYQWSLENDGQAMIQVGETPSLDADMDAAVAAKHATGRGIVVAVIDSGVDFDHPDLADARWSNDGETCGNDLDDDDNGYVDDCHGWDFAYGDNEPYNMGLSPHGTHVAGTIAARRDGQGVVGVAPEATIMDLNVGLATANGMTLPGSAITAAVRYAVDNGADVINLSLGSDPGAPRDGLAGLEEALDHAAARGVVVVAAAGNNNVRLDQSPVWPASFDKPNQLTVAASTSSDGKAGFSNYGGPIDLWAPGQNVLATMPGGGFAFMSGTSMAAPNVAGAVAALLSSEPSLTPAEVIGRLQDTSDRFEVLAAHGGAGRRLNAGEALGGDIIDPDRPITELAVVATGLGSASADRPVSATVRFEVPAAHFDEDYHWEMRLAADMPDGLWALVDHPVTVGGDSRSTGDVAAVDLGVTGTSDVMITTSLPAGDYFLVFEAVPNADTDVRLGDPFVLRFEVATAPTGSDPSPETPTSGPTASETPNPEPVDADAGTPTTRAPGDLGVGAVPPDGDRSGPADPNAGITPPANPPDPDPVGPTPDVALPATTPSGSGDRDPGTPNSGGSTPTTPTASTPTNPTPTNPSPTNPSPIDPTPTAPTTPTPIAAAPVAPPTPTSLGSYSGSAVTPHVGPVGQSTAVAIEGVFPDPVRVYFGAAEAESVIQTDNRIATRAPARSAPGPVDIRLMRGGTTVLTITNGFTYQPLTRSTPTASAGEASPTTGRAPEQPTDPGSAPRAAVTSPPTEGTGPGVGEPAPGSPGPAETPETGPGRVRRSSLGPDRTPLRDGLRGVRYEADLMRSTPPCRSNTCPAARP